MLRQEATASHKRVDGDPLRIRSMGICNPAAHRQMFSQIRVCACWGNHGRRWRRSLGPTYCRHSGQHPSSAPTWHWAFDSILRRRVCKRRQRHCHHGRANGDEIIASLSTSSAAVDDDNDGDDEDPEIAERKEPITKACATEAITTLRMYFECCENTDEAIFKSLNSVEIAVSTSKQTLIFDIFKTKTDFK